MSLDDPYSSPGSGSLQDPTIAEPHDPLVGTSIGRYTILDRVAKGGTATVYRALDSVLNREVAVKILHEHLGGKREVVTRFKNEAQVIAQLRHQNIVTVFDFLEHAGRAVLVVEYMPGETLSSLIKEVPRIPEDFVLMMGLEILQGLKVAHQKGVTHRDIKPANILVHPELGVKISDFGLAKLVNADDGLTKEGIFVGTPSFSSPEQIEGKPLDQRSDIFSLGLTLYILATRSHAFKRQGDSTTTVWFKIVKGKFESMREKNPDLSPDFERIINRSLEVDRNKRYASADEMISDIEKLMRERSLIPYDDALRAFLKAPTSAKNISRAQKQFVDRRAMYIAGALGVFIVLLWTSGFLFQRLVRDERSVRPDSALTTSPDAKDMDGQGSPSVLQETGSESASARKSETEAQGSQESSRSIFAGLSSGVYQGRVEDSIDKFQFESIDDYRQRFRSQKIALPVSSRFSEVDLELNPFTQDLKLDWQGGPEASTYRLEVSTSHSLKPPIFTGSVPTRTMTLERFWDKSQTIFWRVSYLDESQNVFLMDPIRRINLKIKGVPQAADFILPLAGDVFKVGSSFEARAIAPVSSKMKCFELDRAGRELAAAVAKREGFYLKAINKMESSAVSLVCEIRDTRMTTVFVTPIKPSF